MKKGRRQTARMQIAASFARSRNVGAVAGPSDPETPPDSMRKEVDHVEPLLPLAKLGRAKRTVNLRAVVDGLLTPDFIRRDIFPGGTLPSQERMAREAQRAGLSFEQVESFGESFARTLLEWRPRFEENWDKIEVLGFDDRFRRLWRVSLCYCEGGFRSHAIDVGLYVLKPMA
jgi:hypothetical protein